MVSIEETKNTRCMTIMSFKVLCLSMRKKNPVLKKMIKLPMSKAGIDDLADDEL